MNFNIKLWSRKIHRWISVATAAPLIVILCTGTLLLLKKEVDWIQPPTQVGSAEFPKITFDEILEIVKRVPEAGVRGWSDIDRLDVRPNKGVIKVRCRNQWEIQIDSVTSKVLQVAYRRSDFIESLHDGSWFHEKAKLAIFLPTAVLLIGLYFTGLYLFWLPHQVKRSRKSRQANS